MLKRIVTTTVALSAAVIIALAAAATAVAQAQKTTYLAMTYLQIPADKAAASIALVKDAGTKVIQDEMRSGLPIEGVSLWSFVYAGVPAPAYNYTLVVSYDGTPPEPDPVTRDKTFRRAAGMSYAEFLQKFSATAIGSSLKRAEAATPEIQIAEGTYAQVVCYKITPQRGVEYGSFVQKMLLPLNVESMKSGKNTGWLADREVFPGGADATCDAETATFHKSLASVIPATAPSPDQGQIDFAKTFPGQNYVAANDEARSLRRAVRSDLMRAEWVVARPPSGSGGR